MYDNDITNKYQAITLIIAACQKILHVFGDENQFSNGIFLRYKHSKDDKLLKIGFKVTKGENEASKKLLIKNLQKAISKSLIELHNDNCNCNYFLF